MSTTDDPRAPALAYFAAVRKAYIDALRHALDEETASAAARGAQVFAEAKVKDMEHEDGRPMSPEELEAAELPRTWDLMCHETDGSARMIHVVPEHDVPWEAARYRFGSDFLVLVKELVWHRCEIIASPLPAFSDWQKVRAWFLRWFDPEPGSDSPFGGCVHHIGRPLMARAGDKIRVTFDLGSAPVDALLELLLVFEEMGATEGLLFSPAAGSGVAA